MNSRPVKRIEDVIRLRAAQFSEDNGGLAHLSCNIPCLVGAQIVRCRTVVNKRLVELRAVQRGQRWVGRTAVGCVLAFAPRLWLWLLPLAGQTSPLSGLMAACPALTPTPSGPPNNQTISIAWGVIRDMAWLVGAKYVGTWLGLLG